MAGIIGTAPADPNFYARKSAQLGDSLALIASRMRERKEREDARARAEIDRFVQMASAEPTLADTWGADLARRYGSKYPEISPLVGVFQKRAEIPKLVEQVGTEYEANYSRLLADHERRGQEIAQMPEVVPQPTMVPGSPFPSFEATPNAARQRAQAEYEQIDPAWFPNEAANQLGDFRKQAAARLYAKSRGMPIPERTAFDKYGDLPADLAAVEAAREGRITGETAEASRYKAGLKTSPAVEAGRKFSREEREEREASREEDRIARTKDVEAARLANDRLVRGRIAYQDSLSRARESRRVSNERGLIAHRAALRGDSGGDEDGGAGGGLSWKDLVESSKTAQKDYDADLSITLKGEKAVAKTKQAFIKEHGTRPRALTPTEARRIAAEVRRRVAGHEVETAEALDVADELTADFMARTSNGEAPAVALKGAIAGEAPKPVPVTRRPPAWAEGAPSTEEADLEELYGEPDVFDRMVGDEDRDSDEEGIEDEDEPGSEDDGIRVAPIAPVRSRAQAAAPELSRDQLVAQAKHEHPDWSRRQIDSAVDAYLATQAER